MSESPEIHEIRERLSQLINLVCKQAEKDLAFQDELKSLLGLKAKTKKAKPRYDLYGRYGELGNDLDALRKELEGKPQEELIAIAVAQKIDTKKALVKLEGSDIVEKLITFIQATIGAWGNPD